MASLMAAKITSSEPIDVDGADIFGEFAGICRVGFSNGTGFLSFRNCLR